MITRTTRRAKALAAFCALGLLAAACGDDDDDTEAATSDETTTTVAEGEPAAGEYEEYCAAVAEMEESEGFEAAQFERIKETAPEEISEEIDYVADAFIEAEGDMGKVFADPEVEAKLEPIEAFEAEHCATGDEEEDEEQATEPLEGAQVVDVTAVDFAFEGIPDMVPAGDVSFSLSNEGESAHEMFMARLGDGIDLDELLARDEAPSPEEAEEIGGAYSDPGGETVYLNAEGLEPGTYAVVCFIPGPDGKAHYELGMKQTFTVA